jgi:hypothetical protein
LRDRLPCVGRIFAEGLITYRLVSSIVWRTMLIKDPDALRAVDAALALAIQEWEPMSAGKTVAAIDHWVERFDAHALRRSQEASRSRSVQIGTADGRGLASLWGILFAHHAAAPHAALDGPEPHRSCAKPLREQTLAEALATRRPRDRQQRRRGC